MKKVAIWLVCFVGVIASTTLTFAQQTTNFPVIFFHANPFNGPHNKGIYADNSALVIPADNVPNLPDQSAYLIYSTIYNAYEDEGNATLVSLANDAPNLAADPLWIGWESTSTAGRPNLIVRASDGTNVNMFRVSNIGVMDNDKHVITVTISAHGSLVFLRAVQDNQDLSSKVTNYRNNVLAGTTPLPPINIPLKKITRGNQIYPNHFTFLNRADSSGNPVGIPYQFAFVGHTGNTFLHFAATQETTSARLIASFFQNQNSLRAQQFSFAINQSTGQLMSYPYIQLFGEVNLVNPNGPLVAPFNMAGPPQNFQYNNGVVIDPVSGQPQNTILFSPPAFTPPIESWLITDDIFEPK